jgi:Zn-dependent protease
LVAAAGPAANLGIALVFGLLIQSALFPVANELWFYIVLINVSLLFLNLLPIPPLDGSKILSAALPYHLARSYDTFRAQLEYNPFLGFGLVILFILVFGDAFGSLVRFVAQILAGM